jgi:hypothetical protein
MHYHNKCGGLMVRVFAFILKVKRSNFTNDVFMVNSGESTKYTNGVFMVNSGKSTKYFSV